MRGKFHSQFLELVRNANSNRKTRSAPIFPFRLALILPVTALAALATVSCNSGGNSTQGQFPVANAGGPYLTNAGQALSFDGSQSTAPSGQSLTYAWDFGDGGTATGVRPTHTYVNPGNFTAKLTVTDTAGATNSNSVPVEVVNLPVSNPGGPYTGKVNVAITFNGSASTVPPGQTPAYSWNFGDNSTGTGAMPTHAYASAGTFTVTLSVRDDTGGVGTNTTTATISAGPSADPLIAKTFLAIRPGQPGFAYVAGTSAGAETMISANSVDEANGSLNPMELMDLASTSLSSGFELRGISVDPLSRFLFVYGNDAIVSFAIAPGSGLLTLKATSNLNAIIPGAAGNLVAFHPSGRFAFVPTQRQGQTDPSLAIAISIYRLDPDTGEFSFAGNVSSPIRNPSCALIDPTGKFLYIAGSESGDESSASTIAAYSVEPETGALIPIDAPLATSSVRVHVNALVADPSGRFVYAAGNSLDTSAAALSVFSIDKATGELTEFAGSPFSVGLAGSSATSLSFDPAGKFAYVLEETPVSQSDVGEIIEILRLDTATGVPSSTADITLPSILPITRGGSGALGLFSTAASANATDVLAAQTALAPKAFLYVMSQGDAGISIFSIDSSTGQLNSSPPGISPPVKMPIAAVSH